MIPEIAFAMSVIACPRSRWRGDGFAWARAGALRCHAEMAGYSGTPLPRKLGIGAGSIVGLLEAPTEFLATLGELPEGVRIRDASRVAGPFDVIVCFARSPAALAAALPRLLPKMTPTGGLWIAWLKKTARAAKTAKTAKTANTAKTARNPTGATSDLGEAGVRATGLGTGLVDNKVCAIDELWSGLRFVVRLANRPAASPAVARAARGPRGVSTRRTSARK